MMPLTRSAQKERERIVEVHRSAVMETFKMMLGAGMPGGKPHERQKTRWIIKGFEMATDALRRAIDETSPDRSPIGTRSKARREAQEPE